MAPLSDQQLLALGKEAPQHLIFESLLLDASSPDELSNKFHLAQLFDAGSIERWLLGSRLPLVQQRCQALLDGPKTTHTLQWLGAMVEALIAIGNSSAMAMAVEALTLFEPAHASRVIQAAIKACVCTPATMLALLHAPVVARVFTDPSLHSTLVYVLTEFSIYACARGVSNNEVRQLRAAMTGLLERVRFNNTAFQPKLSPYALLWLPTFSDTLSDWAMKSVVNLGHPQADILLSELITVSFTLERKLGGDALLQCMLRLKVVACSAACVWGSASPQSKRVAGHMLHSLQIFAPDVVRSECGELGLVVTYTGDLRLQLASSGSNSGGPCEIPAPPAASSSRPPRMCDICSAVRGSLRADGSVVRTSICTGCFQARYCSIACQRMGWQGGHRRACIRLDLAAQAVG